MHRFTGLGRFDKVSFATAKIGRFPLRHQIFPLWKFHLAQIDDIVISVDKQIYLRLLYTFVGICLRLPTEYICQNPGNAESLF